ncbi:hypothetical protein D3C76_716180 [compost metagenome]
MLGSREGAQGLGVQVAIKGFVALAPGLHRHGAGQQAGLLQARQLLTPEALASAGILALQPGDIVPVRGGCDQVAPGIQAQHLADQLREAPAVHQDMVVGPDQLVLVLARAHQQHPLQGWLVQGNALCPLLGGKLGNALLLVCPFAAIDYPQRGAHAVEHELQRFIQLLPDKASAQNAVASAHLSQCGAEALAVQALDRDAELVDVHAAGLFVQALEQHALLHRRQRIKVSQLGVGHRQPCHLLIAQAM